MPYMLQRHHDESYSVVNIETGRVASKHTTKDKAEKQIRLLRGVEHGMTPMTPMKNRKRKVDETRTSY